jgi:hypothetical protein
MIPVVYMGINLDLCDDGVICTGLLLLLLMLKERLARRLPRGTIL